MKAPKLSPTPVHTLPSTETAPPLNWGDTLRKRRRALELSQDRLAELFALTYPGQLRLHSPLIPYLERGTFLPSPALAAALDAILARLEAEAEKAGVR